MCCAAPNQVCIGLLLLSERTPVFAFGEVLEWPWGTFKRVGRKTRIQNVLTETEDNGLPQLGFGCVRRAAGGLQNPWRACSDCRYVMCGTKTGSHQHSPRRLRVYLVELWNGTWTLGCVGAVVCTFLDAHVIVGIRRLICHLTYTCL